MTGAQNTYFKMVYYVKKVCLDHSAVWTETPFFAAAFASLETQVIDRIASLVGEQSISSSGITYNKRKVRGLLEEEILKIAESIEAYAIVIKDGTLRKNIHRTQTMLKQLTDRALIGEAEKMAAVATALLDNLGPFHITTAVVEGLQALSATYIGWLGKPQAALAAKKQATAALASIIVLARTLLDEMDGQMIVFKASSPAFYAQYFSARSIGAHPKRHLAIRFLVLDAQNKPLAGARIALPALELAKHTGTSGRCYVPHAAAGTYACHVQKDGYLGQTIEVSVNAGERTDVRIELQADVS